MSELIETDIASFFAAERRDQFIDCSLLAPQHVIDRVSLYTPPNKGPWKGYRIEIRASKFKGNIDFQLGPGGGSVIIESSGPINASFRMWRNSRVFIGSQTTITKARLICDDADVEIGRDGLWSDEIILQSNDQHGIVDLQTRAVINGRRRKVKICDHVWIGRRAIIMPDLEIGWGSILATGSVLTSDMPPQTVFGGVPARQIRSGVTWSRAPTGLSAFEDDLIQRHLERDGNS